MEGNFRWLELEINNLSRVPDQQLQRRQHVYRHQGVQQALVLVQYNRKHSRFDKSLLKNIIFRPFWSLTYLLLTFCFN